MGVNNGCFGKFKIETPEKLQTLVDAYFDACDAHMSDQLVGAGANAVVLRVPDPKPYTWTGLALAVGLSGRQAIFKYTQRDGFDEVLLAARMRIQEQWEGKLQRLGNNGGVMFALTNNTIGEEKYESSTKSDVNIGGQVGNPLLVDVTTLGLTEEQLKTLEGVLASASSVLG